MSDGSTPTTPIISPPSRHTDDAFTLAVRMAELSTHMQYMRDGLSNVLNELGKVRTEVTHVASEFASACYAHRASCREEVDGKIKEEAEKHAQTAIEAARVKADEERKKAADSVMWAKRYAVISIIASVSVVGIDHYTTIVAFIMRFL